MAELGLKDAWREQHPGEWRYTWGTDKLRKRSRLDFFLISEDVLNMTESTNIESGYRTDHSLIEIEILKCPSKPGPGIWKFNTALLKDKDYSTLVEKVLENCLDQYATLTYDRKNLYRMPLNEIHFMIKDKLFLDTLLMMIRTETIRYAGARKRRIEAEEKTLRKHIEDLENEINNSNTTYTDKVDRLENMKSELEKIRREKINGIIVRSRVKWYEEGEKCTSYFLNLESRNYIDKQF